MDSNLANTKIIVFDIGGTLMEYRNMPNVWTEYYPTAFKHIRESLHLDLSDEDIAKSVEIMKSLNPRVNYREEEYSPEKIFEAVTTDWNVECTLQDIIREFFDSMELTPYIYPETISVLEYLREQGIYIATLTDVAAGMPDELHKSYFEELQPYFDLYVSSLSCGYRKPNPKGLQDISGYFQMPVENMIFVGDEEKDIMTAKRFGCRSILIDRETRGNDFGQDVTIRDLRELLMGNRR
ncbi:MAG: HAD family hydrolase [Lachnospiraceae bacterium]|nr:HAD family hydrolase [Lachnospiraceae bacterium]